MLGRKIPDFFGEMIFDSESEYEKPFCIIIDGLSSSGKTYLAKELAKGLNLYLLNSDYVRYSFYNIYKDYYPNVMRVISHTVNEIDMERISILCSNSIPFIYDGNKRDGDVYDSLSKLLAIGGYDQVRIRVNTSKEKCFDNLKTRTVGLVGFDELVMGDCIFYNPPFSLNIEELGMSNPDCVIDNIGTLEDFDKNIKELITKISKARGRKNER